MVTGSIIMKNFMVIDIPTHYNAILKRNWIHIMKVIPSSYYQVMKYPIDEGIKEIKANQEKDRSCYNATIN